MATQNPTPPESSDANPRIRRDLRASVADGVAFSVMVGCGETYIVPFALAVGVGPVTAGLIATLPLLFAATVQLVAPMVPWRIGTNRGWVVGCVGLQAASFLPMAWWAIKGHADAVSLFVAVAAYWTSGMISAPAWNEWIGTLIPPGVRISYFARRNLFSQAGVLVGFVIGGAALQAGQRMGRPLDAFALLFLAAAACRFASMFFLAACSEPEPPAKPAALLPADGRSILESVRARIGSPTALMVVYLWSVSMTAQFSAPYFTPYMLRECGFSYWAFMLVVATSFLAKSLSLPMLGRVASRIGSVGLLWVGGISVIPLSILWLFSDNVAYLVGVQTVAGTCWAAYELAVILLFFDAVSNRDRAGVVAAHTFGVAVATVIGAAVGGGLLKWLGEDRNAYFAVFAASSGLRLLTVPLLWGIRAGSLMPGGGHHATPGQRSRT